MKTDSLLVKDVKLTIENSQSEENIAEVVSAINSNDNVTWIKFVLTDDKPNANGMTIPREEFSNIVRTGMFMPVKLSEEAAESLNWNHPESKPLGVITHLADKGDYVEALAALWSKERPEDIETLRDRFENGGIDVSWEVSYDLDASEETDNGITLRNVNMNAATIVDFPAYQGRTPILALASLSESTQVTISKLMRKVHDGESIDEQGINMLSALVDAAQDGETKSSLDKVMSKVSAGQSLTSNEANSLNIAINSAVSNNNNIESILKGEEKPMDTISREDHEKIVGDLQDKLEAKEDALNEAQSTIETLEEVKEDYEEIKPQYEALAEFKKEYDEEVERQDRLETIEERFAEAGIEVTQDYLEAKAETLLSMNDEALDFFIQELVAFRSKDSEASNKNEDKETNDTIASISLTSRTPDFRGDTDVDKDDIVEFLNDLDN